jgi:hypothetical protein
LSSSRQRRRRFTPVMISIPPPSLASPLRASLRSETIILYRRRPSPDGYPWALFGTDRGLVDGSA